MADLTKYEQQAKLANNAPLSFTTHPNESPLSDPEIKTALAKALADRGDLQKVLIVPPDITRLNAYAGPIVGMLCELLPDAEIDVLPALGTHVPMTEEEIATMFPGAKDKNFLVHNWRTGITKLGEVPADFVSSVCEGRWNEPVDVEASNYVIDPSYDLVISIGQVVPHEVVGMANFNKNILVGCGGSSMINSSHYIGALYGMERMMGRDLSPVHKIFDYAEQNFLMHVPLMYVLTVTTTTPEDVVEVRSLGIGRDREVFRRSIEVSQKHNLEFLDEPIRKAVVYLRPDEFRTTWLGNKAIYRTRMAMADDGELIIIGPGVRGFGEDEGNDVLIAKYGYVGYKRVGELVAANQDLRDALGVAAHLIHGSSEGRFRITYAPGGLTREQVESVNFGYMPYEEAIALYDPAKLKDGFNIVNGEEVFYVSNPALGLWAERHRFYNT